MEVKDLSDNSTETQETFLQEAENYVNFKVAKYIAKCWFPVLIPLGIVGNSLSFLVMISPNNRKISTYIYMAAISINDNLMLFFALHDWLIGTVNIREWYLFECIINVYFHAYCLQCGTYQVVAMTIDKYVAIKWPHRTATYSTPRRAKVIIFTIISSIATYNLPHIFITTVVEGNCYGFSIESILTKIYSWTTIVLYAIIPFTLLIHMNYVIVSTVRSSRKMFRGNAGTMNINVRQKHMKSAENQLTTMLLLVTTLFFILLLPTYIRFIYTSFMISDTAFKFATSLLIFEVSYKLYVTNSGVNFFLYCVSGKKFRNDLKEIVCCIRRTGSSSHELRTDVNAISTIS